MSARPIFLLGMMGAGKSSVGRVLAGRMSAVFIDLDTRIELLFGASIARLFELGEDHFRACERAALRSLLREPGFGGAAVVVATGGGLVTDAANLDDIERVGVLVYLELAPAQLAARLSSSEQLAARPLLEHDSQATPVLLEQRLTRLLRAREQAYRRASVIVDADATIDEVADRVERALYPTEVA